MTIFFSQNNKIYSWSKHINILYLVVKDYIKKHELIIKHIRTKPMIVDPMVKGLLVKVIKDHVANMGIIETNSIWLCLLFLVFIRNYSIISVNEIISLSAHKFSFF